MRAQQPQYHSLDTMTVEVFQGDVFSIDFALVLKIIEQYIMDMLSAGISQVGRVGVWTC
jgi:hypothetical protein